MKIIYDNIIFTLQKSGGVSVVWGELLKRINNIYDINLTLYNYPKVDSNIVYALIKNIINASLKEMKFRCFEKYRPLKIDKNERFIFHSSYYRICKNRYSINITTVHDFTYEYYANNLKKFIHCRLTYYALRNSNYIICISENTKKDLLKFLPDIDD